MEGLPFRGDDAKGGRGRNDVRWFIVVVLDIMEH